MDEQEFNKLSHLCRISCTEEEKRQFLKGMTDVLAYIELLQEVETQGVEPSFSVHETLHSVLREDLPEEPLPRDLFLANAPDKVSGMVKIPPVLK
jgi:aspartyl-tRNA(Asn)/glutamyl-tRNA(Gln) amidotransferase subunit C